MPRTAHYKLTSTVILHLANETDALGGMDLSGNMTRQVECDQPAERDGAHVVNIGKMVEDMEFKMRNLLRMYFSSPATAHSIISPNLFSLSPSSFYFWADLCRER